MKKAVLAIGLLLVGNQAFAADCPVQFGDESYLDKVEPLAKFIERGEFSLCSRGGGAGAQAGAGLSCVTRSI